MYRLPPFHIPSRSKDENRENGVKMTFLFIKSGRAMKYKWEWYSANNMNLGSPQDAKGIEPYKLLRLVLSASDLYPHPFIIEMTHPRDVPGTESYNAKWA